MGLFEHWPYTNYHDLNLNWIISKIKNIETAEANTAASEQAAAASAENAAASEQAAAASAENAAASEESAGQSAESAQNYAEHIADPVGGLVTGWLDDNITPTTPPVDASLTIQGAAADAKKTGDEISDLRSEISSLEAVPYAVRQAMDTMFLKMVVNDDDVYSSEYNIIHAWVNTLTIVSISAVFEQGSNLILSTDNLDALKDYLTVTATYENGTSSEVSAYTLIGELTGGTNTVTVTYQGKTTSFTVDVTEASDATPLLSTIEAASGANVLYNSEDNSVRVWTKTNGTYRRAQIKNVTVEHGYTYKVKYHLTFVNGIHKSGYCADNALKGYIDNTVESKDIEFTYTPSADDASVVNNYSFYCTYGTSQAGDCTINNFKVVKYLTPEE